MPGPQTHREMSTWHFWHICKGPTDNQLMWESKSHAKELFKNLRSAQAQQQKPRAGSMRTDMEDRPRKPPATSQLHLRSARRGDLRWGQHSPRCWAVLGGAFSSIQMTWNNLNVSFWTETGSNYAKKLEDSQYSNDSAFILTTKMYLCSHRQAFAIWSGHKALPNWAKGLCPWEEWDIKVRPCAWLAGRTALESRDKQRWSHTTYTPSHPQEGKWVE